MRLLLLHCIKGRSLVYCHLLLYTCPVNLRGKQNGQLLLLSVYTYAHSFTTIKDQSSGSQRVWFTIELQVKPAPPDYTLTLVSPALSSTNVYLKIDSPHFEPLQLEVLYNC